METKRQRILVVDDSALILKILGDMLKDEYEVFYAKSGEEGLKVALKQRPDLILLDIMMSGMNGYEVCKRLKEDILTANTPIIFISGLDEVHDEQKGLEAGAIDYITKPFSEPIVKIRVKNHLELKRSRDILEELTSLDGLTGIYNRRHFNSEFEREWKYAVIRNTYFSLAIMDIDYFKAYNDHYGHLAGDECLKQVAQSMHDIINRTGVTVSRYGGEEFICLMPDTDINDAAEIVKSLQKAVDRLQIVHQYSPVSPFVTVSIGTGTIVPCGNDKPLEFINEVDKALYLAKKNGRNQTHSVFVHTRSSK